MPGSAPGGSCARSSPRRSSLARSAPPSSSRSCPFSRCASSSPSRRRNAAIIARQWYGMFSIFIPVYAFLFVPIRSALAGDTERFLERTAKIQWGLMVCVYFVSYAPALLTLHIPGYQGQNAKLLFFFACVVQISDVLQYVV